MPHVENIPLHQVKVLDHISDAKAGALLQVGAYGLPIPNNTGPAVVGLRCEWNVAGGSTAGLVLLEGARAGVVLGDQDLNHRPAIDVSALARVVLHDPAPASPMDHPIRAGDVCRAADQDGGTFLCMAVTLSTAAGGEPLLGYAQLTGAQPGLIGEVLEQFYVGRATVEPFQSSEPGAES